MVLYIDEKYGGIESWTGRFDHVNYHLTRTKNLTIAETFEDYSNGRRVVGKSAKYGHDIGCKQSCSHRRRWVFMLFHSPRAVCLGEWVPLLS